MPHPLDAQVAKSSTDFKVQCKRAVLKLENTSEIATPNVGNEKSARSFSDRSFFMDVRAGCPCQNASFSRIWRAWPKFSAGCPQGYPPQNFLFGLIFRSWKWHVNLLKIRVDIASGIAMIRIAVISNWSWVRLKLLANWASKPVPWISPKAQSSQIAPVKQFRQEDVNGEKLTVKKWWICGADFFMVYAELFTVY